MSVIQAVARPRRTYATVMVAFLLAAGSVVPVEASHGGPHIAGTVGEIVDPDAVNGGFALRYVGDPAEPGYSHDYQWDNPYIESHPEGAAVVVQGTLDLTARESNNSVAMIGLLDKAGLESGSTEFQKGAYVYVNNRPDGTVRIGVTDGNVGGEIVQVFRTIPAATADAAPIEITFTVDGTVDPSTCAVPASDAATADGCMTLESPSFATVSDSYGTIVGSGGPEEFATGGIPGWEAFPSGASNVGYDLAISPATADPQNKDQCKDGGWADYGFGNQGHCVSFVETGRDSR